MLGDPRSRSKLWKALDREIGEPGENRGQIVAHWEFQPALKTANDPREMLEQESAEMNLSPEFKALLERFVPKTANRHVTEPLSA